MTIEERLQVLTMNLELVSRNQEAMQATQEAMQSTLADVIEDHEKMQSEIRIVLGAQVLMNGSLDKLTKRVTELADIQIQADGRMAALILTVDQIIRGKPQ